MDLSDKDKFSSEQRNDDHLNYQHQSSTMSTSWPFGTSNLTDQPMGLLPINSFVPTCTGDVLGSSNCSSVSMVESFSPNIWGNPNSQNLGLSDNVQAGANIGKAGLGTGGAFLAQTLSQFPADSAFIERAARFSCFTDGGFTDMLNPFNVAGSVNRHFKDGQTIQGPPEVVGDDGMNLKHNSGTQSPINEPMNMKEISEYGLGPVNRDVIECSPTEKLKRMGSSIRPSDEEKQEIGASSNESYEPEVSGSGGQGEPSGGQPSSLKGFGLRKRKRIDQDTEINKDETLKESSETKQKTAQTPGKATKHNKDSSRNSDAPKEDYIHVRARRGQATNSHSLAERVRREKISERMKFLQDLVPGCNKVTGKAVMLDEIINYVQSLQRQVEFLSMKLAAVNPRLDLNTEALLAKDVREALQSRGGSSTFPFSQDARMVHPRTHPTQPGLIQPRIHGMDNSSDALGRTNYSQLLAINGGYRGPTSQIPNMWDDELNNVLQMNFGTNSSFNGQDTNASQQPGHMKDEL